MRPICAECQRKYEATWRAKNKKRLVLARQKRRERDRAYRYRYIEENPARYLVSRIKSRCEKKTLPFDLTDHMEEIKARIAKGKCEMTGLPLRKRHGKMAWNSPSLDRVIPSRGYLYSNIRVVCFAMNAAMGNWGEKVLRKIVSTWLERTV